MRNKNIDLVANNTSEAKKFIKNLTDSGFEVNHIYTGSSVPVLKEKDNFYVGTNNIKVMYLPVK